MWYVRRIRGFVNFCHFSSREPVLKNCKKKKKENVESNKTFNRPKIPWHFEFDVKKFAVVKASIEMNKV